MRITVQIDNAPLEGDVFGEPSRERVEGAISDALAEELDWTEATVTITAAEPD